MSPARQGARAQAKGSPGGRAAPGAPGPLGADELLDAFRDAALLRAVDSASLSLSRAGEAGPVASLAGLEAVLVGACLGTDSHDWLLPGVRQSAVALVRGASLVSWLSQVLGRSPDPARGRQAPGGASWRSLRVVSAGAPVGSHLPHATGLARAMRSAGRGEVAVALSGHGACATGDFHVALNFAATWRVPAVFVIARGGTLQDQTASETVAEKGAAYALPASVIDGGEVSAVASAVAEACARARAGEGPTLLDAVVPDPPGPAFAASGPRALDEWTSADPLARLAAELQRAERLSPEGAEDIRRHAEERVAQALAKARAADPPAASTLFTDVFESLTPRLRRQRAAALFPGNPS